MIIFGIIMVQHDILKLAGGRKRTGVDRSSVMVDVILTDTWQNCGYTKEACIFVSDGAMAFLFHPHVRLVRVIDLTLGEFVAIEGHLGTPTLPRYSNQYLFGL